jgi:hypothetical protein
VNRVPAWDGCDYLDPDTGQPLKTWDHALAQIDDDADAKPAHVMRFGAQVDIRGSSPPHPTRTGHSGTWPSPWPSR